MIMYFFINEIKKYFKIKGNSRHQMSTIAINHAAFIIYTNDLSAVLINA